MVSFMKLTLSPSFMIGAIGVLVCLATQGVANDIAAAGQVKKEDVESSLLAELVGKLKPGATSDRLSALEAALRITYDALPKDADGHLGHAGVRYALHRLLVQRYGWFVKGLEPDGAVASLPKTSLKEWVPSYLQEVLERKVGGRGLDLGEVAVLAATVEDLIHSEAIGRLDAIYKLYGWSTSSDLDNYQADELINTYLMVYLRGGNFTAETAGATAASLRIFKKKYAGWKDVEQFAQQVRLNLSGSPEQALPNGMDFETASRTVEAIGTQFGSFNDVECRDLKSTLLGIEDRRQGRVALKEFYRMGLHTHWEFTEKIDYLRTLGALDESEPSKPLVIVPNYLGSRPQCLESSAFYAVCCRNECEDLMIRLEQEIGASTSTPEKVAEIVTQLSTDTVSASRELSATLRNRLQQVADANSGRIPLHGRLFAQWMHHAFPRECPFPHQAGTTSPQTPDEWMAGTGQESTQASEEEMVCHVSGPCGIASGADESLGDVPAELPWLDTEELLVEQSSVQRRSPYAAPLLEAEQKAAEDSLLVFSRLMRTFALSTAALGLAVLAKHVLPKVVGDANAKKKSQRGADLIVSLALLVFPLALISMDYLLDSSSSNEFLMCFLCWALAAMIVLRFQVFKGQPWLQARASVTEAEFMDKCFV